MRLLRDPFIQFLLVGGLVFVVYSFARPSGDGDIDKRIRIDAATQQWLHSNFAKQFRRPPTRLEMGALIRRYTTNEVKYREALTMGLDNRDSIVRRRMMQKFDFLFGNAAATTVPDDQVLNDWYAKHGEAFHLSPRITFQHVWFSPDKRGDSAREDAAAALAEIDGGKDAKKDPTKLGDPFPFDTEFDDATFVEVRRVLGEEFSQRMFEVDAAGHGWIGPFKSGLGYHLVQIKKRIEGAQPPLEQIRDDVLAIWRQQESERMLADMIAKLQGQYDVELDQDAIMELEYTPESESVQIGFGADD
jgi:peptidyl-prolyl cis-trans isomerase C